MATREQLEQWGAIVTDETTIDPSKVDLTVAGEFQVRDHTDPALVDKYALMFKRGRMCPPVVIRKIGNHRVVVSGNHRVLAALKADVPEIPAYFVSCNDMAHADIAVQDNDHGEPLKHHEIEAAVIRYRNLGLTPQESAERLHITKETAHKVIRAFEVRKDLAADGAARWAKGLNQAQAIEVGREPMSEVRKMLARLTVERGLTRRDVREVVRAISEKGRENDRLTMLRRVVDNTFPAEPKPNGDGKKKRPVRSDSLSQLKMHTSAILKAVDIDELKAMSERLGPEEITELRGMVEDCLGKLDRVMGEVVMEVV